VDNLIPAENHLLEGLKNVIFASDGIFSNLVKLANLDPKTDFRFLNLSGVDFGGSDLREFNFTGANLSNSVWRDAQYDSSTIIEGASLNNSVGIDYSKFLITRLKKDRGRSTPRGDYQTTLYTSTSLEGIGLHSGSPMRMILSPAAADSGITIVRTDSDGRPGRSVKADIRAVTATEFAVVLADEVGPLVSTVEHLLAALYGLEVDNVEIKIDGPEIPIMDGSAAQFVEAIDEAGIERLSEPRRYIEVLKPVLINHQGSYGELRPYRRGFRVESEIEFDNPLVGRQSLAIECTPTAFRREVSQARTFGFMRDVAKLWSAGYALGASFENTVVIGEGRILNAEGARFPDEFVRHKVMDTIGDFALIGARLHASYRSVRGGHKLNHAVISALMSDASAWRIVKGSYASEDASQETIHSEPHTLGG
jgi:UDP-3-O-[3-hydroxymyristoyl] N-acetylglucosamine deacetylase